MQKRRTSLDTLKLNMLEKIKYVVVFFQIRGQFLKYLSALFQYQKNHNKIKFPKTIVTLYGLNFKTRQNSKDIAILSYLYEPSTTKLISGARGKVFIDIGAHIGRYSLLAASKGFNVLSFEPNKSNFGSLLENISLNKFNKKIKVFKVGLSDKSAKGTLYINPSQEEKISLLENKDKNTQKENVFLDKLDNIFIKQDIKAKDIGVIKIDTEGTELDVLKGAINVLSKGAAILVIEIQRFKLKAQIDSFLKKFGYKREDVLDGRNYVFKKKE